MAKYNDKALQTMADIIQGHRENGDTRYSFFVQVVAAKTGTTPQYVEQMVDYYTGMEVK